MSLFTELSPILTYLSQIRKVEDYIVFDVLFPNSWKVPKKFVNEEKFVNQGTTEENLILLWFVSDLNEDDIENTKNNILGIINYNLEREEKEKLLENKINELKSIFNNESLDSLKNLKFDIKTIKKLANEKRKDVAVVQTVIGEGQD
jgi:hypothetical protein